MIELASMIDPINIMPIVSKHGLELDSKAPIASIDGIDVVTGLAAINIYYIQ